MILYAFLTKGMENAYDDCLGAVMTKDIDCAKHVTQDLATCNNPIFHRYNVTAVPTFIFLNEALEPISSKTGHMNVEQVEQWADVMILDN